MTTDNRPAIKRVSDQLEWITGLQGLPIEILKLMIHIIKHGNKSGFAWPAARTLADKLHMTADDVRIAAADAQDLGLMTWTERPGGQDGWQIHEGVIPDDKWPLFRTALLGNVRQLPDITNCDQLLLEAMIDLGYHWGDDTIRVTKAELTRRLPRWRYWTLKRTVQHLESLGYLERFRRLNGKDGGEYRLILSPDQSKRDNSVPYRQSKRDNSVPYRQSKRDNSVPYRQSKRDNSVPYRESAPYRELPLREPPSTSSADDGEATLSGSPFFQELREQDPELLNELAAAKIKDVVRDSGQRWCAAWAGDAIERYAASEDAKFPPRLVVSQYRDMIGVADFSEPPPRRARKVVEAEVVDTCSSCNGESSFEQVRDESGLWVTNYSCDECRRRAEEIING